MSEWQTIPIGTKTYMPRSGTQSVERLINLYVDPSKAGAKTPLTIYGTPGLVLWATVGDGPIRGVLRANGYVWTVSGTALYAVNESTGLITEVGTIDGLGPVRMIADATYVVVCAQTFAYAATLTSIALLSQDSLSSATYQDGYGIYTQRNTQNVWISNLDDLSTISALDFTTADAQPDNVVACISHRRELWVLKERTGEVFYNSGDASFPFVRTGGGYMERGISAPGSLAKVDDYLMWLGDDLRVYRAASYVPEPVSTEDIDRLISEAYSPSTAEAFSYTQAGHTFYVLTFADLTLAFDATTGVWHERRSYGLDRWRAHGHCRAGAATHLVGDYDAGLLYELDLDTYTENGDILERIIISPPLSADPRGIIVHELALDIEAGVGLTSGQGSDPIVMLAWSDDDGRTWSADRETTIGAIGVYRQRARFTRLGRSHNRSWRFRISDPVKVAVLGAQARLELSA